MTFTPPTTKSGKPCKRCRNMGQRCYAHGGKKVGPRLRIQTTEKQARTRVHQDRFLDAFRRVATITAAALEAEVSRAAHYDWMANDPDYPERFEVAEEEATEVLESEARRRAFEGTEEPVFYQGEQCGTVRKYSDVLTIFLLKARRPDVYRERHEISGPGGGPIQQESKVDYSGVPTALLEELDKHLSEGSK